jgi:2',3'-cyclic-nucleotide 2'-phosphodiesterase (5'-nucleotidase family)
MKTIYGQVAHVDNGGFFPIEETHRDVANFMMDMMKTIGVDAVNVGEGDLRFGRRFLEERVRRNQLPVTSANLLDAKTGKPVFAPYILEKIGNVNVGFFGLLPEPASLGPAADSFKVEPPLAAARRTVAELRKKGASVVVLLSQLGKSGSEDLVSEVDGIDAVVTGKHVPLMQKGRMVRNTVANYGGEQGHYAVVTSIRLDARGRMTTGEAEAYMLGPEIRDRSEVLAAVKDFDTAFNEKQKKIAEAATAAAKAAEAANPKSAPVLVPGTASEGSNGR